jgi:hypothetical protein
MSQMIKILKGEDIREALRKRKTLKELMDSNATLDEVEANGYAIADMVEYCDVDEVTEEEKAFYEDNYEDPKITGTYETVEEAFDDLENRLKEA